MNARYIVPTNPLGFTTSCEINFIDWLGTYSRLSEGVSRLDMLVGYRKGIALRTNWNGMDKARIEDHLATCITEARSSKGAP